MKFSVLTSLFLILSMQLIAQDNWSRDDFIISIKEDLNRPASNKYKRVGNTFLNNFIQHSYNKEQETLIYSLITSEVVISSLFP